MSDEHSPAGASTTGHADHHGHGHETGSMTAMAMIISIPRRLTS